MKKMKLLFTFLIFTHITIAQNFQTVEEVDDVCSQLLGFSSNDEAELAVEKILDQIGVMKRIFELRSCPNINNAAAMNVKDSSGDMKKYILYDLEFMDRISNSAGSDWAAISILAHEIGHHILDHSLNNKGSKPSWELEADYWSGWAMGKLGATLNQAQSGIATIRYTKATSTHPAKADRMLAVEKGWRKTVKKRVVVNPKLKENITDFTNFYDDIDIEGQGREGSTVGFAISSAVEFLYWKENNADIKLSVRYLCNNVNNLQDRGIVLSKSLDFAKNTGIIEEKYWKYRSGEYYIKPENNLKNHEHFKINEWEKFEEFSVKKIKELINQKEAIIATVNVGSFFYKTNNGVVDFKNGRIVGKHIVNIIAYDDDKNFFKFINSWGEEWGDNGYGYLSYNDFQDIVHGITVLR